MKFTHCQFRFFHFQASHTKRLVFEAAERDPSQTESNDNGSKKLEVNIYRESLDNLNWKLKTMSEMQLVAPETDITKIADEARSEVNKKRDENPDNQAADREAEMALKIIKGYEEKYLHMQEGCRMGVKIWREASQVNNELFFRMDKNTQKLSRIIDEKGSATYQNIKAAEETLAQLKSEPEQIAKDIAVFQNYLNELNRHAEWAGLNTIKIAIRDIMKYRRNASNYNLILPRYTLACQIQLTAIQQKYSANQSTDSEKTDQQNKRIQQMENSAHKMFSAIQNEWRDKIQNNNSDSDSIFSSGDSVLRSEAFEKKVAEAPHTELKPDEPEKPAIAESPAKPEEHASSTPPSNEIHSSNDSGTAKLGDLFS